MLSCTTALPIVPLTLQYTLVFILHVAVHACFHLIRGSTLAHATCQRMLQQACFAVRCDSCTCCMKGRKPPCQPTLHSYTLPSQPPWESLPNNPKNYMHCYTIDIGKLSATSGVASLGTFPSIVASTWSIFPVPTSHRTPMSTQSTKEWVTLRWQEQASSHHTMVLPLYCETNKYRVSFRYENSLDKVFTHIFSS